MRFKYVGSDRVLRNATISPRNLGNLFGIKLENGEEYNADIVTDQLKYTTIIDGKPVVSPELKFWFAFPRQTPHRL